MGAKLRNLSLSLLIGGLAAVIVAPPAHANRGNPTTTTTTQPGYVPPPQYGQDPQVLPEEDPYAPAPVVEPTVVPVDLPVVTDPGAGLAGGGDPLAPAPSAESPQVLDRSETRPEPAPADGFMGGILSRTGAETLPLARAGLAAVALGLGLVVLARRRRVDAASA
ncbi:MAG: hypothetical protein AB1679_05230 [Actinomycetota bacterium]|jgi:hypothetical protein